ncbi:MAG TPA: hypothetical protein VMS64_30835 [Candidatus Methylomirabilis sp.]|nr:hypothetical protein [Candidatus Methylomirabilis sp.]
MPSAISAYSRFGYTRRWSDRGQGNFFTSEKSAQVFGLLSPGHLVLL